VDAELRHDESHAMDHALMKWTSRESLYGHRITSERTKGMLSELGERSNVLSTRESPIERRQNPSI
jgi:hypothetical protein